MSGATNRRGRIRLSLTVLRDALGLPPDMRVHGIERSTDDLFADAVTIAVSGAPCPEVAEEVRSPDLMPVLQRSSNGRVHMVELRVFEAGAAQVPLAEVIDAPVVWFVGQLRYDDDDPEESKPASWEMQGIFATRELAVAACRSADYFVSAVELNAQLPMSVEDTTRYAFFPLAEGHGAGENLPVLGRDTGADLDVRAE